MHEYLDLLPGTDSGGGGVKGERGERGGAAKAARKGSGERASLPPTPMLPAPSGTQPWLPRAPKGHTRTAVT